MVRDNNIEFPGKFNAPDPEDENKDSQEKSASEENQEGENLDNVVDISERIKNSGENKILDQGLIDHSIGPSKIIEKVFHSFMEMYDRIRRPITQLPPQDIIDKTRKASDIAKKYKTGRLIDLIFEKKEEDWEKDPFLYFAVLRQAEIRGLFPREEIVDTDIEKKLPGGTIDEIETTPDPEIISDRELFDAYSKISMILWGLRNKMGNNTGILEQKKRVAKKFSDEQIKDIIITFSFKEVEDDPFSYRAIIEEAEERKLFL